MDRKRSPIIPAVLLVWFCLPSTSKLFTFFKRRYAGLQISELNSISKWRDKMIVSSERIRFLRKCLEMKPELCAPKDFVKSLCLVSG